MMGCWPACHFLTISSIITAMCDCPQSPLEHAPPTPAFAVLFTLRAAIMSNAAGAAGAGAGVDLVVEATSESHFNSILEGSRDRLVTVFFWEDFHEASRRGGQMDMVVTQLARAHPDVKFVKVGAHVWV